MRPDRTWHEIHVEQMSTGSRIADVVATALGSWTFILAMTGLIAAWIAANLVGAWQHWDPYPFILLNLAFSAQATYAAPLIMMTQNRQSERDREQAKSDYETNVAAKQEIEELMATLSRLELEKLDRLLEIVTAIWQDRTTAPSSTARTEVDATPV